MTRGRAGLSSARRCPSPWSITAASSWWWSGWTVRGPMTPSIALSKAYSAAVMQRPTSMLEGWRNSDPVFFTQVGRMGQHPIVATKGGYTLKRDGAIVGGFGVSGGSPDEDQKICEDVLRAAGFDLDFPEWAGSKKPH